VKLVVVIAGRVEIEGSAAISFLVSGRSTARNRADCMSKSLGSDSFTKAIITFYCQNSIKE
jgi:hypothetical protein